MFKITNEVEKMKAKLKDINKEMSNNICCFTGHRPQKLPWGFNENDPRCADMRKQTAIEIENAINNGYEVFLTGMALGFDMICAEIILELKKKYPNIKLIGALPCWDQYSRWNIKQKDRYLNLLDRLDGIRCIYDHYIGSYCMLERNHYMISNSSLVIALYNGKPGGTAKTLDDAKKQGLKIIIINPLSK